jgi:DNA (cytosine-5)-methyltransferase 1
VLGTLADLGYGLAWRIVNSRYFGVPQRRRRVFILGTLADGDPRGAAERAGEVLAVGSRCERHPPTGAAPRPDIAGTLGARTSGGGRTDDLDGHGAYVPHYYVEDFEDGTLTSSTGRIDRHPLLAEAVTSKWAKQSGGPAGDETQNLTYSIYPEGGQGADLVASETDVSPPIAATDGAKTTDRGIRVANEFGVRRLTPTECERLQALPDGWTALGPDSRRYAALGDAVTATVAEWIGRRLLAHIQAVAA